MEGHSRQPLKKMTNEWMNKWKFAQDWNKISVFGDKSKSFETTTKKGKRKEKYQ